MALPARLGLELNVWRACKARELSSRLLWAASAVESFLDLPCHAKRRESCSEASFSEEEEEYDRQETELIAANKCTLHDGSAPQREEEGGRHHAGRSLGD
jgi:hypothetical protein